MSVQSTMLANDNKDIDMQEQATFVVQHRPIVKIKEIKDLKQVSDIENPEVRQAACHYGAKVLKPIQGLMYEQLLGTDNLVISAPTGTGKTLTMIMGIATAISSLENEEKIVVLAPTKALGFQHTNDLKKAFPLKHVKAFNKDCQLSERDMKDTDVFIMTIEKLDKEQRNHNALLLFSNLRLLVVDEIHVMKPSLELLLSNLAFQFKLGVTKCRLLAFSATIPKREQFATFLNAKCIHFGDEYRSVELCVTVMGMRYSESMDHRDKNELYMEECSKKAIAQLRKKKTILVFAPSIHLVHMTAAKIHFMLQDRQKYICVIKNKDSQKSEWRKNKIAVYHSELTPMEKRETLKEFGSTVKVLVCTEALAAGINTSADFVIVMSTTSVREGGKEVAMRPEVCEQMIGRAGRSGHCDINIKPGALILTEEDCLQIYLQGMVLAHPITSVMIWEELLMIVIEDGLIKSYPDCESVAKLSLPYKMANNEEEKSLVITKMLQALTNLNESGLISINKGFQNRIDSDQTTICIKSRGEKIVLALSSLKELVELENKILKLSESEKLTIDNIVSVIAECQLFEYIKLRDKKKDIMELAGKIYNINDTKYYKLKNEPLNQKTIIELLIHTLISKRKINHGLQQEERIIKATYYTILNTLVEMQFNCDRKNGIQLQHRHKVLDILLELKVKHALKVDTEFVTYSFQRVGDNKGILIYEFIHENLNTESYTWVLDKNTSEMHGELYGAYTRNKLILNEKTALPNTESTSKRKLDTEELKPAKYVLVHWNGYCRYEQILTIPESDNPLIENVGLHTFVHKAPKISTSFNPQMTKVEKTALSSMLNQKDCMIIAHSGQGKSNIVVKILEYLEYRKEEKKNVTEETNKITEEKESGTNILYLHCLPVALKAQNRRLKNHLVWNLENTPYIKEETTNTDQVILATPDIVWNEILKDNNFLEHFDLVVIDDAHMICSNAKLVALSVVMRQKAQDKSLKTIIILARPIDYADAFGVPEESIYVILKLYKRGNYLNRVLVDCATTHFQDEDILEYAKGCSNTIVVTPNVKILHDTLTMKNKDGVMDILLVSEENIENCETQLVTRIEKKVDNVKTILVMHPNQIYNWNTTVDLVIAKTSNAPQIALQKALGLGKTSYNMIPNQHQKQYFQKIMRSNIFIVTQSKEEVISPLRRYYFTNDACLESMETSWIKKALQILGRSNEYKSWKKYVDDLYKSY